MTYLIGALVTAWIASIGFRRPPLADRVGGDHARGRDDEHRLMVAVAKDVDVVRDLGGGERRRSRLLCLRRDGERASDDCREHAREANPQHCRISLAPWGGRRLSRALTANAMAIGSIVRNDADASVAATALET
jgi:hypothetical protein